MIIFILTILVALFFIGYTAHLIGEVNERDETIELLHTQLDHADEHEVKSEKELRDWTNRYQKMLRKRNKLLDILINFKEWDWEAIDRFFKEQQKKLNK